MVVGGSIDYDYLGRHRFYFMKMIENNSKPTPIKLKLGGEIWQITMPADNKGLIDLSYLENIWNFRLLVLMCANGLGAVCSMLIMAIGNEMNPGTPSW